MSIQFKKYTFLVKSRLKSQRQSFDVKSLRSGDVGKKNPYRPVKFFQFCAIHSMRPAMTFLNLYITENYFKLKY